MFFWKVLFKKLDIKLLTFTVYYFQMNEQFKHINQTVKIVLCYFLTLNLDEAFITILLYLQDSLNNSWNSFISYALNKLVYEFWINNTFNALLSANISSESYIQFCQIYCEKTDESIVFINIMLKHYYDARHTSLTLNFMTFLWLFQDYIISDLINKKLLNQCVDSFCILE